DGAGGAELVVDDGSDRRDSAPGAFYEPTLLGGGYEHLSAEQGIVGLELRAALGGEGQALALYGARLTLVNRP
ncbi:MAG: hypothetical protein GX605_05250, partial [Chloroflexi bacterium]|nr:hypothetical protein [Chloroflexota bacterium]